jgi:hypothetical protein
LLWERLGYPNGRPVVTKVNPTTLYGFAMAYKVAWGCPANGRYLVSFQRMTAQIYFTHDKTPGEPTGLFFLLDGKEVFHCGSYKHRYDPITSFQALQLQGNGIENLDTTEHLELVQYRMGYRYFCCGHVSHSSRSQLVICTDSYWSELAHKNQKFIDSLEQPEQVLTHVNREIIDNHMHRYNTETLQMVDVHLLVHLVLEYKRINGCPSHNCGVMLHANGTWQFHSELLLDEESCGLWFGYQGTWLYHAGCKHRKVAICDKELGMLRSTSTISSCKDKILPIMAEIIVRKARLTWSAFGYKLECHMNGALIAIRNREIFRLEPSSTGDPRQVYISHYRKFWTPGVTYVLTIQGLKRVYEEKMRKSPSLVAHMAIHLGMDVRAFHQLMRETSVDRSIPDVVEQCSRNITAYDSDGEVSDDDNGKITPEGKSERKDDDSVGKHDSMLDLVTPPTDVSSRTIVKDTKGKEKETSAPQEENIVAKPEPPSLPVPPPVPILMTKKTIASEVTAEELQPYKSWLTPLPASDTITREASLYLRERTIDHENKYKETSKRIGNEYVRFKPFDYHLFLVEAKDEVIKERMSAMHHVDPLWEQKLTQQARQRVNHIRIKQGENVVSSGAQEVNQPEVLRLFISFPSRKNEDKQVQMPSLMEQLTVKRNLRPVRTRVSTGIQIKEGEPLPPPKEIDIRNEFSDVNPPVSSSATSIEDNDLKKRQARIQLVARHKATQLGLLSNDTNTSGHSNILQSGDVEQNPGPVIHPVPTLSLLSPSPVDNHEAYLRRNGYLPSPLSSEAAIVLDSIDNTWRLDAVEKHLRQRYRECKTSLAKHTAWRQQYFLHRKGKRVLFNQRDATKDVIQREMTSSEWPLGSALANSDERYDDSIQRAVDYIGMIGGHRTDDRHIHHVVTDLTAYLKQVTNGLDLSSIIFMATAWKAARGCPANGLVTVIADPTANTFTILWTEELRHRQGQLTWMLGDLTIAHCATRGRSRSPRKESSAQTLTPTYANVVKEIENRTQSRARSRSLTPSSSVASRSLNPLRDKIDVDSRLMTILGAKEFGKQTFFAESETKDFLREKLLSVPGDVEQLVASLNLNCSLGNASGFNLHFNQLGENFNGEARYLEQQTPSFPSIQRWLDWIEKKCRQEDIVLTDVRNWEDMRYGIMGAFKNAKPTIEMCGMIAMMISWKKRWGCPSDKFITITANTITRIVNVNMYERYTPEQAGVYWYWDGYYLGHCGKASKYLPKFSSPYDQDICTTRHYALCDGHVQTSLRHKDQHSGVRKLTNKGMHGLPLDFLEDIDKSKATWFDSVYEFLQYVVMSVDHWAVKHKHRFAVSTANSTFKYWKWPIVNFVQSGYNICEEIDRYELRVHTRFNGPTLRNIRAFCCFFPSKLEGFLIANGAKEDHQYIRPLEPTSDLPWPKCCVFWTGPYAANNLWVRPNCLRSTISLRQFINPLTVYGGDEVIFNHVHINTVVINPENGWTSRPFHGLPQATDHPARVTFWNRSGNELMDIDRFTFDIACQLFHKFYPGRPILTMDLHLKHQQYTSWDDVPQHPDYERFMTRVVHLFGGEHPRIESGRVRRRSRTVAQTAEAAMISLFTVPGVQGSSDGILILLILFIAKFWVWAKLWYRWNFSYLKPTFPTGSHPWVSEGYEEYPSYISRENIANALTIQTLGTTGDRLPMKYLANVAANLGIVTHINHRNENSTQVLEGLKTGDVLPLLPAYYDVCYSANLGYRASLQPHAAPRGKGAEYSLSPPRQWIAPPNFSDRLASLPTLRQIIVLTMNVFVNLQRPQFYIGNLPGCSLPRAVSGIEPLTKRRNFGHIEHGWLSGSASEEVIPKVIRDAYPRIPDGDHSQIFRNYKYIHCHGGAGTVQTAIACGAQPIIHDNTLDRNYHRAPSPSDFKQPSLLVYYGWILDMGFVVSLPLFIRVLAYLRYLWHRSDTLLVETLMNTAKLYLLTRASYRNHEALLMFLISVPPLVYRFCYVYTNLKVALRVFTFLWSCPYVLKAPSWLSVFLLALHYDIFTYIGQDIFAWQKQEFSILRHPVHREGYKTFWPFGHYAIRDNRTGDIYEGRFVHAGRNTLQCPFVFSVSKREMPPDTQEFPCQVNLLTLKSLVGTEVKGYGPTMNCTTLVLRVVRERSFLYTIWLLIVVFMTGNALACGWLWEMAIRWFKPEFQLRGSSLWHALGFAAAEGEQSFEIEPLQVVDVPPSGVQQTIGFSSLSEENMEENQTSQSLDHFLDPNRRHNVEQVNTEQCLTEVIKEIATITAIVAKESSDEDRDIILEAGNRTLATAMVKLDLPDDPIKLEEALPDWKPTTWQEVRDAISAAFVECKRIPFIAEFLMWINGLDEAIATIAVPITKVLLYLLRKVYDSGKEQLDKAWKAVCMWLDHAFGPELSKRVKTVWGATGLWRTSFLDPLRELEANLKMSAFVGKSTFLKDYEALCEDLKRHALAHPVAKQNVDLIGGPQYRNIKLGTPMMSHNEAAMLGLKEGEYHTTPFYEEFVNKLLQEGVPQGSDGVFYAQRNPDKIDKSFARYEHQYSREYDPATEALVLDVANSLFNQYRSSFEDSRLVSMHAVTKYLKLKYSAGVPFIRNRTTKTRQMLQDKGFLDILKSLAEEYLTTGKFPVEFFHGFEKSQVVDLSKILAGKNVRTVVANFLLTTYMEHIFQLDRNKRDTWQDTGMGSGMPLNQGMVKIWEKMADAMKLNGGRMFLMDATEFDSKLHPVLFSGAAELDRLSFKDHPSGKGKEIASVFKAKYDALQDAWILGITRPEQKALCIGTHDPEAFKFLVGIDQANLRSIHEFVSQDQVDSCNHDPHLLHELYNNIRVPDGTVVVTHGKDQCPGNAQWNGRFEFGDPTKVKMNESAQRPFTYKKTDWRSLEKDIKALCQSDFSLTSRVYDKERGGATGFTSTTFTNGWTFRIGIITAWCQTTGKRPEEFFLYNDLKNTSDDTIWFADFKGGLNKVKDIYAFKRNCMNLGIQLTLDTTRDITQAEYLSKTVAPPNREDAADLQSYRYWAIRNLAAAGKLDPNNPEHVSRFDNPRFLVKQNVTAIGLRSTALRYYQGSQSKYLYSMIARSAGHASVCAFRRGLYCSIAEGYCGAVNALLNQHKIWQRYELRWEKLPGGSTVPMPHVIQVNPRWTTQKLSPAQKAVLVYIRTQAKFPSYLKVIDVHMNVKAPDPQGHSKFLAKLQKGSKGWDSAGRDVVDWLVTTTNLIPESWANKFMPGVQASFPDNPFYTKNEWVAKFTLSTMLDEGLTPDEIDYPSFATRVAEGPYGAVTNTISTWENWNDPKWRQEFMCEDKRKCQAMVLMITFVYIMTYFLERIIIKIPLVGVLWLLYTWSFWGRNRIYGLANTTYYHAKGKSSRTISAMMPKDPFIVAKRISAVIVDFVPEVFGYLLYPCTFAVDALVHPLEQGSRFWKKATELKSVSISNQAPENPWAEYATPYVKELDQHPLKRTYISAPTATGKSSMFPAAVLSQRHRNGVRRIWLVVPRIILREEWSSPYDLKSQRLMRGVRISRKADIYILTYGHFLNRLHEVDQQDLVLFDEFHELSGEMIRGEKLARDHELRIFLMSATPLNLKTLQGVPTLAPPLKRRFRTKLYKFKDDRTVVQMFQYAKNLLPDLIDETMIVVPTLRDVTATIASLQWLGHTAYEVSSRQKKLPESGIIVSTPYTDTGLDIKPPRTILIDSGRMVAIDKGRKVNPNPPTDAARNKQRVGRVSRHRDGYVFQSCVAGTGKPPTSYPGGFMFEHREIAEFYEVPQLTPLPANLETVKGLTWLHIDKSRLANLAQVKSLLSLHLISMTGERNTNYRKLYNKIWDRSRLGEEQWWLESIICTSKWKEIDMLPWEEALTLLSVENTVAYGINGTMEYRLPIVPVLGIWQDSSLWDDVTPEEVDHILPRDATADEKLDKIKGVLSKFQQRTQTVLSESLKTTLYADVSRIIASITTA